MILYYRPIKKWPEGWPSSDTNAPWSPFKSDWQSTLRVLDDELRHLGTQEATLQLDTAEGNCRADGGLRGDARVNYRGVILSFDSATHGTLTYPCDAFDATRDPWRQNVRAIALGLRSLRTVERYGIANRGQQYAGYAELPMGIPLAAAMSKQEAATFIAEHSGLNADGGDLMWDGDTPDTKAVAKAYAAAVKLHHPDVGGDPATFRKLTEAREILEARNAVD